MKHIQFIIVGWHFDRSEFYDGLRQFKKYNNVKVFWSCHREPPDHIKENFDWAVFPNHGLEWGCYQQALDHLNLPDDTVIFFLHDDLVIKDWKFIDACLYMLDNNFKVIGNGMNYPKTLDPTSMTIFGRRYIDMVKEESKHYFTNEQFCLTIRGSFMCTTRKNLRKVNDFEVLWEEPEPGKGYGTFGNTMQWLLGYKITKEYGVGQIAYLSETYQDSQFIFECARGKVNK